VRADHVTESADTPTLDAVLKRLRSSPNDPVAWEQFFQCTWPFVMAMSHRSLPAVHRLLDADDIAQEVFLKFARYWREKRPAIGDPDRLFSLLAVMTRRMAGDAGRWLTRARRDSRRNQSAKSQEPVSHADYEAELELRDLLDQVSLVRSTPRSARS
jgi:DNA-directed RNA polymerase specialized sigma24 family protein